MEIILSHGIIPHKLNLLIAHKLKEKTLMNWHKIH